MDKTGQLIAEDLTAIETWAIDQAWAIDDGWTAGDGWTADDRWTAEDGWGAEELQAIRTAWTTVAAAWIDPWSPARARTGSAVIGRCTYHRPAPARSARPSCATWRRGGSRRS